ncbi:glyoxalase [Microlunatus speluncae]|uniref:glyoxalase n=1 Tax=Microlunatus speluncae TaxID=2594267 RepID=UPI0012666690|nr:glyoxalase [Microlunatus speluncae]
MNSIDSVIIETPDPDASSRFFSAAFGVAGLLRVRESEAATSGFRGFTLSLVVAQPSTVDSLVAAALAAGATEVKPVSKSLWGYGGVVQAPDGTICTIASGSKKDTGPATLQIDDWVLQLGVDDVGASKRFYVDRGFTVANGFGGTYVQFDGAEGSVKLALYKRRGLAKTTGVSPDGSGSHRLAVVSDAGPFTDPDGYTWE